MLSVGSEKTSAGPSSSSKGLKACFGPSYPRMPLLPYQVKTFSSETTSSARPSPFKSMSFELGSFRSTFGTSSNAVNGCQRFSSDNSKYPLNGDWALTMNFLPSASRSSNDKIPLLMPTKLGLGMTVSATENLPLPMLLLKNQAFACSVRIPEIPSLQRSTHWYP